MTVRWIILFLTIPCMGNAQTPRQLQRQQQLEVQRQRRDQLRQERDLRRQTQHPKTQEEQPVKRATEVRTWVPIIGNQEAEEKAALDEAQRKARIDDAQERQKKKRADDQVAKKLALADGARLKTSIKSVFGVALGAKLNIPNCDTVGRRDERDATVTSDETCWYYDLSKDSTGETKIFWAEGAIPSWAESVTTDIRDDVLVGVRVTFMSGSRRVVYGNAVDFAVSDAFARKAAANVKDAHKELYRKYGRPSREHLAEYTDGTKVPEPSWDFPGLRVRYSSDPEKDSVVIELESIFKENARKAEAEEAAAQRL